jgi:RHS repeat-associated protein
MPFFFRGVNIQVTPHAFTPEPALMRWSGQELLRSEYDPAGRLLMTRGRPPNAAQEGTAPPTASSLQFDFTYDGFGRKKSQVASSGLSGQWTYDGLDRITNVSWNDGTLESLTYDPLRDIITHVQREIGTFQYTYDKTDQLIGAFYSGSAPLPAGIVNRSWSFDLAGNRSDLTTVNNVLTSDQDFHYKLDDSGFGLPLERKTQGAESVTVDQFQYRAGDQKLKRYENAQQVVEYFYDGLGRRALKRVTPKSVGSAYTQAFTYLGTDDKVLLTRGGDNVVRLHVDGQGIDEHLGEVGPTGSRAYATDHLGSVLNGEAAGSAKAFGPWGEVFSSSTSLSPAASPVQYAFTGRQLDIESLQYYYRARQYSSTAGRFLSRDTIWPEDHLNPYVYGLNDPLGKLDPFGLAWAIPGDAGGAAPMPAFGLPIAVAPVVCANPTSSTPQIKEGQATGNPAIQQCYDLYEAHLLKCEKYGNDNDGKLACRARAQAELAACLNRSRR